MYLSNRKLIITFNPFKVYKLLFINYLYNTSFIKHNINMVIYNFSKEFGENGGQCVKYFVKKKRKIIKP